MLWLPGHIDLADTDCCVFVKTFFFIKTVFLNQKRPPLTVRGVAVFLHRTWQLKADSQTEEPKQDAEEVSKTPQQTPAFRNTGYDNGYKEISLKRQ